MYLVEDKKNNKSYNVKKFEIINNKLIINNDIFVTRYFKIYFICERCKKKTTLNYRSFINSNRKFLCKNCKTILINIEKYGCEHSFQSENNKKKSRETCLEKYGVSHPMKNFEIVNKLKKSMIEKYGVENTSKLKEDREKTKKTMIKKYGFEYFSKSKKWHDFIKENKKEINNKIYKTKKKNNSFNISKPEEITYQLLVEKYKNVIRQYKDERYPFACDFYIPEEDLFIECNFTWTHGKESFDENNEIHLNKLNKWKSKNTKYYQEAIKTWTGRDVLKRNTALENELNYIEIFKFEDLLKKLYSF